MKICKLLNLLILIPKKLKDYDTSVICVVFQELRDAADDIREIAIMYANVQHALCLLRCKSNRLTTMRPPVKDLAVFEDFQDRKPYQYLQICYWKVVHCFYTHVK